MFEKIRADLRRASLVNASSPLGELLSPGTQAVLVHRFGHWAWKLRVPILRQILLILHAPVSWFIRGFAGVNIPNSADIGPGLVVHTWSGVFLPPGKIGANCLVQTGVVINWGVKKIGESVRFGPGCKIIRPVSIGDGAYIGANAVVMDDVPDDSTVVGMPAKVVKVRKWRSSADKPYEQDIETIPVGEIESSST